MATQESNCFWPFHLKDKSPFAWKPKAGSYNDQLQEASSAVQEVAGNGRNWAKKDHNCRQRVQPILQQHGCREGQLHCLLFRWEAVWDPPHIPPHDSLCGAPEVVTGRIWVHKWWENHTALRYSSDGVCDVFTEERGLWRCWEGTPQFHSDALPPPKQNGATIQWIEPAICCLQLLKMKISGIWACFLSFFPLPSFFPAVHWSTVFVQRFYNGTLWSYRWMNVKIITLWLEKKKSSFPLK